MSQRPGEPLAARMRPRSLDEFTGQAEAIGPGSALRRQIAAGSLPSFVLIGPPGIGKTSLARLVAEAAEAEFVPLSAVAAGVAEVRAVVAEAEARAERDGRRTALFIDEIHRFSKSQQDVLLPHVEAGAIALIGATTEHPGRSLTPALLSRILTVRLRALTPADLRAILARAVADPRGYEGAVELDEDVITGLIAHGDGDARRTLNLLEAAVALASLGAERPFRPSRADVEAMAADQPASTDASGHISAFIKSIRGNDPDGAVYWLAAMISAGEDPRFIARRLLISAGEDIGAADARALPAAAAAMTAADLIGLPEITFILSATAVMLAGMPKSPRAGQAYGRAATDIASEGIGHVPFHLRPLSDAYRHPHGAEGFDVAQVYLPARLAQRRFYQPSEEGLESQIKSRLARLRERRGRA